MHKALVESDTGVGYELVPINLQLDLAPARLEIDLSGGLIGTVHADDRPALYPREQELCRARCTRSSSEH